MRDKCDDCGHKMKAHRVIQNQQGGRPYHCIMSGCFCMRVGPWTQETGNGPSSYLD